MTPDTRPGVTGIKVRRGPPCTVCHHEQQADIEAAIVGHRGSLSAIARRFGFATRAPVTRHARKCIPRRLARAALQRAAAGDASLVELAQEAYQRALDLEADAKAEFDACPVKGSEARGAALANRIKALAATRGIVALLKPAAQVNVVQVLGSPEGQQAVQVIFAAVASLPGGPERVAQAIRQLEEAKP